MNAIGQSSSQHLTLTTSYMNSIVSKEVVLQVKNSK